MVFFLSEKGDAEKILREQLNEAYKIGNYTEINLLNDLDTLENKYKNNITSANEAMD